MTLASSHWDVFCERLLANENGQIVEQPDGSIVASCPCPTHGNGSGIDNNPSLRAFINEEKVIVLKCRTGCATPDVLKAMGLSFNDLYEGGREGFTSADDYAVREAVYETLLSVLELAERHRLKLHQRGFTDDEIERYRYRTLKNDLVVLKKLDGYLQGRFDREDLARVPGFDENGNLLRSVNGLLIPLRRPPAYPGVFPHMPGPIYLLKSYRSRHEKGSNGSKYHVWSSPHLGSSGGGGGNEPGYHWAEPPAPSTPYKVPNHCRIAEGEYKADLTAARMGIPSISMPGTPHWQGVINFLGADKVAGFEQLRVAWDWADVIADKGGIRKKLFVFLDHLRMSGYAVGLDTWDTTPFPGTSVSIKGIDDAIAAKREIVQLTPEESWSRLTNMIDGDLAVPATALPSAFASDEPAPFPVQVLPSPIRDWAIEIAETKGGVAVDYVACPALVVVGRALGTVTKIEAVKDWRVQANLFMVVVAPPGSGKSPSMKAAMAPIRSGLQRKESKRFDFEWAAYKEKLTIASGEKKKLIQPPEPCYTYWLDDFTSEAMAVELDKNSKSKTRRDAAVLIYNDELSAWVKNMNRYRGGEGSDRENFLKAWAGEDIKVDRKNPDAPSLNIESPFVCVLGATTPDVVSVFETKGGKADGFFPRLLFTMPPVPPPYSFPETLSVAEDTEKKFSRAKVWDLFIRRIFAWEQNCVLIPTEAAYNVLTEYSHEMKKWQEEENLDDDMRAMLSKNHTHALRLSLIVHAMRVVAGESSTGKLSSSGDTGVNGLGRKILDWGKIEKEDAEGAIQLIRYFQEHYVRVRRCLVLGPEDRRVTEFVTWVKTCKNRRVIPREVYSKTLFGCRGKAETLKLFKAAEDRGKGIVVPIDGEQVFVPRG